MLVRVLLAVTLLTTVALAPTVAPAATCESLAALALPDATITVAESVPAGTFDPPGPPPPISGLPAFCRVVGVATPTRHSVIGFEVWMPLAPSWNAKFQGVGSGGSAGAIQYGVLAAALRRDYATMATDNGHIGSSWTFAFPPTGHPEKVVDFGYRAQHVTTVAAKAIIQAFYGTAPRHSYFVGCSQGGHHALMEVQRYPGDYDGVIAGAPANFWSHLMVAELWASLELSLKDPANAIPPSKIPVINQAVVNTCDALDGIVDGVIDDPRRCNLDPATLQCEGPDAPGCLTAAQVEGLRRTYDGPRNPRTGERLYAAFPKGGEISWPGLYVGNPVPGGSSYEYFRHGVYEDPNWDFRSYDFDQDVVVADTKLFAGEPLAQVMDAVDPDLSAFRAFGGKLIMYHGWADGFVTPYNTVDYYNNVVAAMGQQRHVADFARLFMVPGMGHCAGGPGPNAFGAPFGGAPLRVDAEHDVLSALERWVEHGIAPDKIIATRRTAGVVDRTRPLCPYPQRATYKGSGSIDEAANFVCK
jgi:feruloyl esterase